MSIKPSLGYKELNDSIVNITSVSTNNSPLLRRLQISKIKHLLTFKSKISPMTKDNFIDQDSLDLCPSQSLPSSPMKKHIIKKPSNLSTHSVISSSQINDLPTSDSTFHKKIQRRVRSALSLPRSSLTSPTMKIKGLTKQKSEVTSNNNLTKSEEDQNNIYQCENKILLFNQKLSTSDDNWPTCYHPIDEIRDVVLSRVPNKRFGIKLDRTDCGEQITYIVMILPGSIAQMSGLKVGDQIIRVDSMYVHQINMESLVDYIRSKKDSVRIFYKARSLLVRTKVVQLKKENNRFGLRLIRRIQGVFVDYVIPNSSADNAHLKEGDQLLKINNVDVSHWSQEKATHLLKTSTQTLILHVYDATFAANDCLHQKNIFFDDNSINRLSSEDEYIDDNDMQSLDGTLTQSLPNSPRRSSQKDLKNHC